MWWDPASSSFLPRVLDGNVLPTQAYVIEKKDIWLMVFDVGHQLCAPVSYPNYRKPLKVLENNADGVIWFFFRECVAECFLSSFPGGLEDGLGGFCP